MLENKRIVLQLTKMYTICTRIHNYCEIRSLIYLRFSILEIEVKCLINKRYDASCVSMIFLTYATMLCIFFIFINKSNSSFELKCTQFICLSWQLEWIVNFHVNWFYHEISEMIKHFWDAFMFNQCWLCGIFMIGRYKYKNFFYKI